MSTKKKMTEQELAARIIAVLNAYGGLNEIESGHPMSYGQVDCWAPMNRHAKVRFWEPFLRPEYRTYTEGCAGCGGFA